MKNLRLWVYEHYQGDSVLVDIPACRVHVLRDVEGATVRKRHKTRIETAYQDALMFALWRSQGIVPSRRYALIYGVTQNRYENAIGLLRMARVVIKHRTWVTDDLATIRVNLKRAKDYALEVPEAYHARLIEHARN